MFRKIKGPITYWKCGVFGHWGQECTASEVKQKKHQESQNQDQSNSNNFKKRYNGHKAFMAMIDEALPDFDYWYVENGCTDHMTDNQTYFCSYQDISHERRPVQGIGSALLTVAGVGDIVIKIKHNHDYSYGILKGVIHVPLLGHNLFSSFVVAQKKIYTLHTDTRCQMLEDGKVVMTGVIYSRLYPLNIKVV